MIHWINLTFIEYLSTFGLILVSFLYYILGGGAGARLPIEETIFPDRRLEPGGAVENGAHIHFQAGEKVTLHGNLEMGELHEPWSCIKHTKRVLQSGRSTPPGRGLHVPIPSDKT